MSDFTTRPEIIGTFGVVATTHWLATATAMAVLEKGGNAFDAAVATGLALQVVEPHLSGPGGEAPLILYDAKRDAVEVICGQGTAPAAATIPAYRELGLDLVPGNGLLAAVVPGAFDAYMLLLRDRGTWSLEDVLAPAIGFAADGCPLVANACLSIDAVKGLFEADWPTSAAVYLPNGDVPRPGAVFRNPDLAATYRRIVREAAAAGGDREARIEAARRAWYRGFVAEAIDRFLRGTEVMDVSGRPHRGLLTADDMAAWRATVEEPQTYDYCGYTVCKTGPWGQGPVFLQQLALLEGIDIASMAPDGPDFVHTVAECSKLAFADREAFYGDPLFADVPMETLLGDAYNDARRGLVGAAASHDLRPGEVAGYGGRVVIHAKDTGADGARVGAQGIGEPTVARFDAAAEAPGAPVDGDTCHFDIIDRHGNMISGTPSGGWLQSSPTIPGLGFCLTNRAQMFWLEEGVPASLAPGKRPRSTLSPALALYDGKPRMVFGSPGGDRQDQWSLHMFLRHVHFGLNLQAAIDMPEFHTDHFPSSFYPRQWDPGHLAVEGRFAATTIDELRRRGHRVEVEDDWCLGRVTAAAADGGVLKAAANPRFMQNYAIGR